VDDTIQKKTISNKIQAAVSDNTGIMSARQATTEAVHRMSIFSTCYNIIPTLVFAVTDKN